MNLTIYHNPRCSKSRKTLELIENAGVTPRIVRYIDEPPSADALLSLAGQVGQSLESLLRTGEADYKDAGNSVPLGDESALAAWLHDHPRVLQRPIVVDEDSGRAVVGRPPENVLELLGS